MKKTALVILLALIVVPVTTSAFSLDGAIKEWMTYMRAKVQTLEKENAALKAQLKSCAATTTRMTDSEGNKPQVARPTPEVIVTANPASVEYGGTATISWKAQWAASCTLNSSPTLLSSTGSQPTGSLTTSTTYTFTCTDRDTAVTGSTTVSVKPWAPPPGVKLLPAGQCTRATAPCITSEGCWGCNEEGKCGREFGGQCSA